MNRIFYIYAGVGSQTAIASKDRYIEIINSEIIKLTWNDLQVILKDKDEFTCIFPIWNCNQGYILGSKLENTIFEYETAQNISISDIWPKNIEFSSASILKNINKDGKIISVLVARLQCSDWLMRINKFNKKFFQEEESTVDAVEKYLSNPDEFHSVICTLDQINNYNLNTIESNIQNNFNYTTFVTTKKNNHSIKEYNTYLYSITISTSLNTISQALSTLIENLVNESNNIESIPRIPFIFHLGAELDGVIFEINDYKLENLNINFESIVESYNFLQEESVEELNFIGNIGNLSKSFNDELEDFHKQVLNMDSLFLKYIAPSPDLEDSRKATFYAVPGFKIFIHGYGESIVKKVAIQYIKSIYNKINNNGFGEITEKQKNTFEAIKEILKNKKDFSNIDFNNITS